jgi:hypothetical protein
MKITAVKANNHRHAFEVVCARGEWPFPYEKAEPRPTRDNPIIELHIDPELGDEGFTYTLKSGQEGSVLLDHVLDYNEEPGYMRDLLLYNLTAQALQRLEATALSRREIIRRLGTSPAQFYRLIDPTNYRKSVDKMLSLLQVLGCEVDLVVRERRSAQPRGTSVSSATILVGKGCSAHTTSTCLQTDPAAPPRRPSRPACPGSQRRLEWHPDITLEEP